MNNLIVIIGATAVGKTKTSLALADHFNCPIISADSRQMYKGLEIGTAMPTKEELSRHKHYFVATLDPDDYYSAARYEQEVMEVLEKEFPHHPTMLLSGGSMLYIDSVCNGIDDIPTVDEETRNFVKEKYANEGLEQLCSELRLLDPEYYNEVDRKNPKRVMHALEICYMTGRTYTSYRTRAHAKNKRPFNIIKIGLRREREELYKRINDRVEQMMKDGLLEEARNFYPMREKNSLNTVGYKELFKYFDGEWELPFAIEKIKQNTRIYSRKQTTWYRRDKEITWFHPDDTHKIIAHIDNIINKQKE
ncbi:MAG: tRNA (adenosine(37)-N6)-dimethylallyltransferase MiaA [Bacteroidales bacterium]|nr:tRNA (adenosine(37)-N6)-dimethylallyltransferase MiaA [Bacteroidales bacterium]